MNHLLPPLLPESASLTSMYNCFLTFTNTFNKRKPNPALSTLETWLMWPNSVGPAL